MYNSYYKLDSGYWSNSLLLPFYVALAAAMISFTRQNAICASNYWSLQYIVTRNRIFNIGRHLHTTL